MKKIHLDIEKAGFYGAYWENRIPSKAALIAMIGDDPEDYMAKKAVSWAWKYGLNVLTMSPGRKDYGHHNYPLERIEKAIEYLLREGNERIAITGASTTGTLSLAAAAHFPQITLTIAFTPSDFIWQGFMRGKKDGCEEWPVEGESLFSWHGEPLPYMPFVYQHPDYWHCIQKDTRGSGDFIRSRKLFDDSEAAHNLREEEMIKVEKIRGMLLLIGAEDDALWDTARYIRRMDQRLRSRKHACRYRTLVYEHGTHFIFPESLLTSLMPASRLLLGFLFKAAREYPMECREARKDIDRKTANAFRVWMRRDDTRACI